jgi:cytochrome b
MADRAPVAGAPRVRVWDRPVRLLHWLLLASVTAAWLTTLALSGLHRTAGYAALGIVAARVAWGFAGSRHARFGAFVRGPSVTARYAASLLARREPRYLGHNPLGGWMVIALLACVAGLGVTGWLYTQTDLFFGDPWMEGVHTALAWLLLALAALHVAGVIFTSLRHRENLVRAMVDGQKPAAGPGDIA